ncbi:MAG: hypothetical protein QM654_17150 [Dysgonamonadaceae bacterium]
MRLLYYDYYFAGEFNSPLRITAVGIRNRHSSTINHHSKYCLPIITITTMHIRIYISNSPYSYHLRSVIVIRTKHQKHCLPIVGAN